MSFTRKPIYAIYQGAVRVVVELSLNNGILFGIEHVSGDAEDDFHYIVLVYFGPLQLTFVKVK